MKSFKDYIAEEHPTWHVTFKTGHKPQKVKGRNTAEAIKKAEKRAQKSGEKDPRQLAMYKGIKKVSEETEIDEAVGTSAKHAGKTGMLGGKYTSKDHMIGMKNFSKIRDKRAAQRNAEHEKQDPKMAKMGYAKHMVDTDKAKAKAAKKGVPANFSRGEYKTKNGIREAVELTEADIAEILRQYALSENVNADQLANLTEEEINEIIGKAIGGAFKLGAKAAVGAGRLAAKGAKKALFNKQGNRRGSMAAKNDRLQAKKDKIQQDRRDLVKNRKLERDVERAQKKLDRSKAAAKKY